MPKIRPSKAPISVLELWCDEVTGTYSLSLGNVEALKVGVIGTGVVSLDNRTKLIRASWTLIDTHLFTDGATNAF